MAQKVQPASIQHLLTVDQSAEYMQVNPMTIRRWIEKGDLRAFRMGRGIRIRLEDLNGMLVEIR